MDASAVAHKVEFPSEREIHNTRQWEGNHD
jgi:hypothetical protein